MTTVPRRIRRQRRLAHAKRIIYGVLTGIGLGLAFVSYWGAQLLGGVFLLGAIVAASALAAVLT